MTGSSQRQSFGRRRKLAVHRGFEYDGIRRTLAVSAGISVKKPSWHFSWYAGRESKSTALEINSLLAEFESLPLRHTVSSHSNNWRICPKMARIRGRLFPFGRAESQMRTRDTQFRADILRWYSLQYRMHFCNKSISTVCFSSTPPLSHQATEKSASSRQKWRGCARFGDQTVARRIFAHGFEAHYPTFSLRLWAALRFAQNVISRPAYFPVRTEFTGNYHESGSRPTR